MSNQHDLEIQGYRPWIGLVHVGPLSDTVSTKNSLGTSRRAYSVFVALAHTRENALLALESECSLQDLEVLDVEDLELVEERIRREGKLDKEVTEMIEWMYEDKIGASLYRLNTYPNEE